MRILKQLALAAAILTTVLSAQAEWVSGHLRSNGTYVAPYYRSGSTTFGNPHGSGSRPDYIYRNPYAASPSVSVRDYTRKDGIYVLPHYRTAPNSTVTDNLSYRGYGTIRLPRPAYGW